MKLNRVKLFIKISIYVKINILSLIFFLFLTFSSFFSLFKILVLACPWKNATKGIVVAADRTVSRLHWCNCSPRLLVESLCIGRGLDSCRSSDFY